jgi:hypothetical protein
LLLVICQAAAHQSMDAAAVWLAEAVQQRAWDARPLHDALRGFLARTLESLQQAAAPAAGAERLAALQRQLCGLAAVADLLQRHGLATVLDPGMQVPLLCHLTAEFAQVAVQGLTLLIRITCSPFGVCSCDAMP